MSFSLPNSSSVPGGKVNDSSELLQNPSKSPESRAVVGTDWLMILCRTTSTKSGSWSMRRARRVVSGLPSRSCSRVKLPLASGSTCLSRWAMALSALDKASSYIPSTPRLGVFSSTARMVVMMSGSLTKKVNQFSFILILCNSICVMIGKHLVCKFCNHSIILLLNGNQSFVAFNTLQ